MAEYTKQFCVEVVTSEQRVAGLDAVYVSLPAIDGEVGILAGRAPLVAAIGKGTLTIQTPDNQRKEWIISGGFAQVNNNAVIIMPETCKEAQPAR